VERWQKMRAEGNEPVQPKESSKPSKTIQPPDQDLCAQASVRVKEGGEEGDPGGEDVGVLGFERRGGSVKGAKFVKEGDEGEEGCVEGLEEGKEG
jgi:hypothetical protein